MRGFNSAIVTWKFTDGEHHTGPQCIRTGEPSWTSVVSNLRHSCFYRAIFFFLKVLRIETRALMLASSAFQHLSLKIHSTSLCPLACHQAEPTRNLLPVSNFFDVEGRTCCPVSALGCSQPALRVCFQKSSLASCPLNAKEGGRTGGRRSRGWADSEPTLLDHGLFTTSGPPTWSQVCKAVSSMSAPVLGIYMSPKRVLINLDFRNLEGYQKH